jgi:hypothetical protein
MRIVTCFFLAFFIPTLLFSQSFNGGVQAGLAVSQIAGDGMSGYNKAGIQAGFFVNYQLQQKLSVQMELAYIQKGSARAENIETGESQYLRRLNYIELPIILQYHLQPLLIEAGLSADFLAASMEEINYQVNDQLQNWRKMNVNTVVGVRYQLTDHWQLILRSINSVHSLRKNSVPLNVRRYSKKYGEFNDVILFGVAHQF